MAEHLASIYGTEKDRVNCPFYFKIGSCRHGDRCSRLHNRPTSSLTLLFSNLYHSPDAALVQSGGLDPSGQIAQMNPKELQEHFDDFYEDIFQELSKHGELDKLHVCSNVSDHMIGNVYATFQEEEHAMAAMQAMSGRFYSGSPIMVEFSPVTDFREATCRQHEEDVCNRGGYCNFIHLRKISKELRSKLFGDNHRDRSLSPRGRGGDDYDRRSNRDRDMGGGGYRGRGWGGGRGGGGMGGGRRQWSGSNYSFQRSRRGEYDARRERSRSPDQRRRDRESSVERRAKIEQWNREKETRDEGDGRRD